MLSCTITFQLVFIINLLFFTIRLFKLYRYVLTFFIQWSWLTRNSTRFLTNSVNFLTNEIKHKRPFARSGNTVQNRTCWGASCKSKSRWTGMSCFALEVPLCNFRDFVPCDRIVQRAYHLRVLDSWSMAPIKKIEFLLTYLPRVFHERQPSRLHTETNWWEKMVTWLCLPFFRLP